MNDIGICKFCKHIDKDIIEKPCLHCSANMGAFEFDLTDHDKQIRDEILDNVQLEVSEKIEKQIRDDERTKVLSYLVDNGYIKYGFDVEYLKEQFRGGENA